MADDDTLVSLADTVDMVSKNYANLREMIHAHKEATDPDGRSLLQLTILVHIYLKIGKPDDIKAKIEEIWDGMCQE